ncbi:MAG: hypothetical protein NZM08_07585 [Chitinophagales bacterium]|nr:hypothetical protein [Chitinophagales bacterium]
MDALPALQEWEAALSHLKPARLRKLLRDAAAGNKGLLSSWLLELSREPALKSAQRLRLQWAGLALQPNADPGRLQNALDALHREADELMQGGNYADAWELIEQVWRYEWPASVQPALASRLISQLNNWLPAFAERVHPDMRQRIYDFFYELLQRRYGFAPSLLEPVLNLLIGLSDSLGQFDATRSLLLKLQQRNQTTSGQPLDHNEARVLYTAWYRLLISTGRQQEADQLLDEQIWIPDFARIVFGRLIAAGNDKAAEQVLHRAVSVSGPQPELELLMLQLASYRNDQPAIRRHALRLFLQGGYDLQYFRLLKQSYSPSRWPQQLERIMRKLREQPDFAVRGIRIAAQIWLEEEHRPDQLAELLRKNCSLELVRQYAGGLEHTMPGVVLELYAKALRRYAEKNSGPEAYAVIAQTIQAMMRLPDSAAAVRALLIELKVSYRHRRALVQLLNKVVI